MELLQSYAKPMISSHKEQNSINILMKLMQCYAFEIWLIFSKILIIDTLYLPFIGNLWHAQS